MADYSHYSKATVDLLVTYFVGRRQSTSYKGKKLVLKSLDEANEDLMVSLLTWLLPLTNM